MSETPAGFMIRIHLTQSAYHDQSNFWRELLLGAFTSLTHAAMALKNSLTD